MSRTASSRRRRSRASRRGRRRRRRRAGTGRRAGCGRRPGRSRPRARASRRRAAPSTTRGARSCQRIASSVVREVRVDVAGTAGARAAERAIAPTPMCTGPTSSPTSDRADEERDAPSHGRQRRAGREGRRAPGALLPTRSACSPPVTLTPRSQRLHLRRDQPDEVDDPRPPARGDVVARRRRTPPFSHRRDRAPARPRFATLRRASGRSTSCRRARSASGSAATMYSAESCG